MKSTLAWIAITLWGGWASTTVLAGELPPPPASMEAVADAQLYLELVVNQMNTQRVVPVVQRQGQLFVSASELQAVGIRLPASGPSEVGLDSVPGLHSEYDSQAQRLLLQVPPDWLPEQRIGARSTYPRTEALSSAVLNEQNGARAVVGWDGLVYLEDLTAQNTLQVIVPDGAQCRASFALPPQGDQVPLIGPVVCQ